MKPSHQSGDASTTMPTGSTPMERFQAERFSDGPWNAIDKVSVPSNAPNGGQTKFQVGPNRMSTRATQGSANAG